MTADITIGFRTADQELDELIRMEFEKEKVEYTNQHTTESLITIIASSTKESVEKLLRFFKRHKDGFTIAFVRTSGGAILSLFDHTEHDLYRLTGAGGH